jgi:hypothetical protein
MDAFFLPIKCPYGTWGRTFLSCVPEERLMGRKKVRNMHVPSEHLMVITVLFQFLKNILLFPFDLEFG